MTNYADSTCLYIIHPWTNALVLPDSMDDLISFSEKLKNKGVFIVTESYSTHVVPAFYHMSDLNLLVQTKDTELMKEYKRRYEETQTYQLREDASREEFEYDGWTPEHDISSDEDYARVYPELIDPYNEDKSEPVFLDDYGSVGAWGIMRANGNHRFMNKGFLEEIRGDIKTKKTFDFSLSKQRSGDLSKFLLKKLKKEKPNINRILIAGGFRSDCVDYAWDSLSSSKYKIRIITKLLVEGVNKSYYEYLRHHPSVFKGKNMKLVNSDPKQIIKKYFN